MRLILGNKDETVDRLFEETWELGIDLDPLVGYSYAAQVKDLVLAGNTNKIKRLKKLSEGNKSEALALAEKFRRLKQKADLTSHDGGKYAEESDGYRLLRKRLETYKFRESQRIQARASRNRKVK